MNYINYDDALRQLEAAGLQIDTQKLSVDGRIQRWKTDDSKGGDKPGWSRLKEWQSKAGNIYIVGAFGVWMGNDDGYTKIELPKKDDPDRPALTEEDIAAARAAQKAAAQAVAEERKREAKTAAGWAAQVWSKCAPATEHDYLTRKQIGPNGTRLLADIGDELVLQGIDDANWWRLKKSEGALVVPMHDTNGNINGLQFIFPKGHEFEGKQFWPTGMAMGGTFGVIGGLRRAGVLLLTEGFATAGSLHEATGQPVAYAFSANNIGKAGKQIRAKYKALRILFCADDDYQTEQKTGKNPGVSAALQAASEIEQAAWTKPDFTDESGVDRRDGKKLSDYNDLAVLTGVPLTLANQINAKLDALKWRDAVPARGGAQQGGGGSDHRGRRQACSVMSLDDIVARFMPLDDGTGKYVFDTWTNKIAHRDQMVTLLPAGVRGDDVKRHPVWIERGAYYMDQVGFDPGYEDKNVTCNLWTGWPTAPKQGSCSELLDLLRYLCSGEKNSDELYEWVLKWLAYPIQHHGAKMQSAVVVHGPQGTGKSRFFEAYASIFGEYSTILTQGAIEDKFNADWASARLFVIADEIVANTEKYHLKNQLKNFITSDWVRINPKNVAAHKERNHMNMVFLSNELQPVVLENDDRRHCVIYTPKKLSEEYYAGINAEIAAGGIEALHHHLLHMDLGDFKPWTKPPMTDAKMRLIRIGAGSEERFIDDWICGHIDLPFCAIGRSTLYAEYAAWCRREGENHPRRASVFYSYLHSLGWWEGTPKRLVDFNVTDKVTWRCVVPAPASFDKAIRLGATDYRRKAEEDQAHWLCGCYYAIQNTINKRETPAQFSRAA